ncbi:hypothetical protein quinque_007702 [Culex quinquefasciatus]
MDPMDEEEIPSLIKNQLHHYEGGGGEPSTNSGSACPYSLRSSTSTSQGSPSSLFAGSSKGSGSLAAKKKSSLLIGSGAGGSSKETNKKQRDSSPVDYLDEAKLRELTAACQRDNSDTPLIRNFSLAEEEERHILERQADDGSAADSHPATVNGLGAGHAERNQRLQISSKEIANLKNEIEKRQKEDGAAGETSVA